MSRYSVGPAKGGRSRLRYIYYPSSWDVARYVFASAFVEGKSYILDAGCSDGYGSLILLNAGAGTVIGADINPKAIEYAKNHYDHEGLDFLCLDATNLPFPNDCLNVIVALEIIEHLPEPEQRRFLSECRRVLKNGGVIICSTPNKRVFTATKVKRLLNLCPSHVKELDIPEFYDLLSEYFVDIALFGQWFMNSIEIIGNKIFLTTCFIVQKFVSLFLKETGIGSFIYLAITSMLISDERFKVLPFPDNLSLWPLTVIAVAKVSKKEPKVSI